MQRTIWFCIALATFLAGPLRAQENPHLTKSKEKYESAESCKSCHPVQHGSWKESIHASAAIDSVFTVARDRLAGHPDKGRDWCLRCHAPTVLVTGDFELKNPITREGVTCDFCHTVRDLKAGETRNIFDASPGANKLGPLKGPAPEGGRNFSFSSLHLDSWFCAGCHELKAENGTPILDTYREWRESPYADRGVRCQDCHMHSETDLPVVPAHVRETRNTATAHSFMGGHSPLKREKAVSIEIKGEKTDQGLIRATVVLVNRESGHMVPTGIPTRRLVLRVDLLDGGGKVIQTREKIYGKILVDAKGNEAREAAIVFTEPLTVRSDNRLPPLVPVKETFDFPGTGGRWALQARLDYEMESEVEDRGTVRHKMAEGVFAPAKGMPLVYILGFVLLGVISVTSVAYGIVARSPKGDEREAGSASVKSP